MENIIPLNGRIAIVDDVIEQALPLMRVLSKNNIPYVFYKGDDINFLPEQPENDIRILFLDLNLLGGRDTNPKDIRSVLFSTINKIISPYNYPYVLILWSRQESEYKAMLQEMFNNELKQCAPITIQSFIKSDFFPDFSEVEENEEKEHTILDELKKIILALPAYSYLMQWENCVHNSADVTIQDVFHDYHSLGNWNDNANCILDMFAHSFLEKHYDNVMPENKAKSSLLLLNDVYSDTLESMITDSKLENAIEFEYDVSEEMKNDIRSKINYKLLTSKAITNIKYPGCVFIPVDGCVEYTKCSKSVLNDCLNTEEIRTQVLEQFHDFRLPEAKKYYKQLMKERKDAIFSTLLPCGIVVTPSCDYAQNKAKYDRVVMGVIIESCYRQFIDRKSEAIYISPSFNDGLYERILVLNYRYFTTLELNNINNVKPLYRIRNSMLAEIQSKLARHINRQGIMNL